MIAQVRRRLERLEAAHVLPRRAHVVFGRDDAEFARVEAEMLASGQARPGDSFVQIMRFGDGPAEEPFTLSDEPHDDLLEGAGR